MSLDNKAINNKDNIIKDENPNPVLTADQKKTLKKKQIIGIVVISVLLAVAIVLTVLCFTVFYKK